MNENYQDAMAIVRKYGKPDLFITMTCNPNWPEIKENLSYLQKPEHRPDLVSRVFNIKLKSLMNDILNEHVLGKNYGMIKFISFGPVLSYIFLIIQ